MTTPASNVTGIQEEEVDSPSKSGFNTYQGQGPRPSVADTGISDPAPQPSTSGFSTYQGQGPRPAVTDAGITPTQVTGPGIAETPDFSGVTEEAAKQGEEQKTAAADQTKALQDQAQKSTEGIQTKLQEGVDKLTEKARKDTEESIARNQVLQERLNQEALKNRSVESRNTFNSFSHLLAQGKDSGFINTANMSAMRGANRRYGDAKLQMDLQFIKESNDAYDREANTVFGLQKGLLDKTVQLDESLATRMGSLGESLMNFNIAVDQGVDAAELNGMREEIQLQFDAQQELNKEWDNNIKTQIENLIDGGFIEEARQLADEASQVSGNKFFSYIQNENVVKGMIGNNDANLAKNWSGTIKPQIDGIMLQASELGEMKQQEATRLVFDILKEQPDRAYMLISSQLNAIDSSEYDKFGLDDVDKGVIEDFLNNKRDINDPSVQEVFARTYMQDLKDEQERGNVKSILDSANIPTWIEDSAVGNEIVTEWLVDGQTSDFIQIDVDQSNVFGAAGIDRIQFYGNPITDPSQLASAPGLDIAFEGFGGDSNDPDAFAGDYTTTAGRTKAITVGGVDYTQGELTDHYLSYQKQFANAWSGLSNEERAQKGMPLNKDQFEQELRNETLGGNEKVELKGFVDGLMGKRDVGVTEDGITVTENQFRTSGGKIEELSEGSQNLETEDKEKLISILEGGDIGSLSDREFNELAVQDGVFEDLLDSGSIAEFSEINKSKLSRGELVDESNHAFSADNIQETLSGLTRVNDGLYEGFVSYGGAPYKIEVVPGRFKKSKGSSQWHPTADIRLIPAEGGDEISLSSKLTDFTGGSSSDKGLVSARAEEWFKNLGGE